MASGSNIFDVDRKPWREPPGDPAGEGFDLPAPDVNATLDREFRVRVALLRLAVLVIPRFSHVAARSDLQAQQPRPEDEGGTL